MRAYLFGFKVFLIPLRRICKSAFLFVKILISDDVKSPQHIKTESQLFSNKCVVKLQEHLNHIAGKSKNFLKNGQDLRSHKSRKKLEVAPDTNKGIKK